MKILIVVWSRRIAQHLHRPTPEKLDVVGRLMTWAHQVLVPQVNATHPGTAWFPHFRTLIVLPEYFLSQSQVNIGAAKALDEGQKDAALATLRGWSQWFPEQLLVPGTIAFRKPLVRPATKPGVRADGSVKADRTMKLVANLRAAPDTPRIQQAYAGNPHAVSPSTADKLATFGLHEQLRRMGLPVQTFIYKNQAFVIQNGHVLYKYNKRRDFFETHGAPNDIHAPDTSLGATQVIHGMTFGFEICFDHNQGALAGDIAREHQVAGALQNHGYAVAMPVPPQIHVVVSASVHNAGSPVREGGLYVHASTADAQSGVWRRRGAAMLPVEAGTLAVVYDNVYAGDRLRAWLAEV
jgi:predicted amidohydrolase